MQANDCSIKLDKCWYAYVRCMHIIIITHDTCVCVGGGDGEPQKYNMFPSKLRFLKLILFW